MPIIGPILSFFLWLFEKTIGHFMFSVKSPVEKDTDTRDRMAEKAANPPSTDQVVKDLDNGSF